MKLLTSAAVAERLQVATDTVLRWGGIEAESVERFIERSRVRKGGQCSPLREE